MTHQQMASNQQVVSYQRVATNQQVPSLVVWLRSGTLRSDRMRPRILLICLMATMGKWTHV